MTYTDEIRRAVAEIMGREIVDAPKLYEMLRHLQQGRPEKAYKRDVRKARRQWLEDGSASPDTGAEVRDRYRYDAEEYHFALSGEVPFSVPIDTVQQWVRWYVHDGGGLTQRTVTRMSWQELGQPLTKDFARRIFAVLGITKDSPPFAPHLLAHYSAEELAKLHFARAQADVETAIRADEPREWRRAWRAAERKLADTERALEDHQTMAEELVERIGRTCRSVPKLELAAADPYMLLVPIYDVHVGKLGVDGSGLRETRAKALRCSERLLSHAYRYGRPEVVQVVFGGDFVHIDSERTTTRGTPQDVAGSWVDIIEEAWKLAEDLVDVWRQLGCRVLVRWVSGNHDQGATYYLSRGFRRIYRDAWQVDVVHDDAPLHVDQYGEALLAFEHGDGPRAQDYVRILANTCPEVWGSTSRRYVVTGHLHHVHEHDQGILILQQPSISAPDRWHQKKGYVTSQAGMRAYVIDQQAGLVATFSSWV